MADGQNGADGQAQPVQLTVNLQYLKDISYENPGAPQTFQQPKGAPNVGISVEGRATPIQPNVYEVVLHLASEVKADGSTLFLVEVDYAGIFTVQGGTEDQRRYAVYVEAPRLLFPFVRALVGNLTREGGFPPLLIAPVDFEQMYRQQMADGRILSI